MTVTAPVVLVVNDEEGSRLVHASWLRRAGYDVIEAGTGAEALEIVSRTALDVVILDVHLPDMSGIDVGEQIKRSRASAGVPVLHLSATATATADRSAALIRGADGYLFEPVEREELLATTMSLVRYHEAQRTALRMAARLEHLHQASLLMSAARSLYELAQYAASGLAAVFGAPAIALLARDAIGQLASAGPNADEPLVRDCPVAVVADYAHRARGGSVHGLTGLSQYLDDPSATAIAAAIATPQGEDIGALLVLADTTTPEDALILDQFAQALAVTLENQRLYAIEHQISLTLQRAMLPTTLPEPAHLDIAARYLAASETAEVGGDFYEAFEVSPDHILLAVGDVVGHSLNAATVMAEIRHSLRAFASVGLPADEIIARLNRMMCAEHPGMTATLCIAEVMSSGDVVVSNAGHIPPVIVAGENVQPVHEHGPLLGLPDASRVPSLRVPFDEGAMLVLVTDGLVERRDEDLDEGLNRLYSSLERVAATAEAVCDQILADLAVGAGTADDIAMLVVRRH